MWKQPPSPGFTDKYWEFRYQIVPPLIYGADTTTKAVFLTDSWKLSNRLTLDLGVRYDDQKGGSRPTRSSTSPATRPT